MILNDKERSELVDLAQSSSLKEDMRQLASMKHNPFIIDNEVDIDRWILFLNEYNEFINHKPKPFQPIIDRVMKL